MGSTAGKVIPIPEKITYKIMLRTNYIPCSSVVMKKKLAEEFLCHDELQGRLHYVDGDFKEI